MKIIKPESLNECFKRWTASLLPKETMHLTIAMDGRPFARPKAGAVMPPLPIISAHLSEWGITLGQVSVEDKRNEIPAVQKLIQELELHGCTVVADALNCQKETAALVVKGQADYLLSIKDNHPTLKDDIAAYIQDETLQAGMETFTKVEKTETELKSGRDI